MCPALFGLNLVPLAAFNECNLLKSTALVAVLEDNQDDEIPSSVPKKSLTFSGAMEQMTTCLAEIGGDSGPPGEKAHLEQDILIDLTQTVGQRRGNMFSQKRCHIPTTELLVF